MPITFTHNDSYKDIGGKTIEKTVEQPQHKQQICRYETKDRTIRVNKQEWCIASTSFIKQVFEINTRLRKTSRSSNNAERAIVSSVSAMNRGF